MAPTVQPRTPNALCRFIANRRRALRLSQPQLAALAGCDQSLVYRIEDRQVDPKTDTLDRLLAALGVEHLYLPCRDVGGAASFDTLGAHMKRLRGYFGLSQRELAGYWGKKQSAVRTLEEVGAVRLSTLYGAAERLRFPAVRVSYAGLPKD